MDSATIQLFILGLSLADKLIFEIGGKVMEMSTSEFTDPAAIIKALQAADAEGFPKFEFKSAKV